VVPAYANPTPDVLGRPVANQAEQLTRVSIQRVYRLDDAPLALVHFTGGTLGKLVIVTD
jgi:hypothetical protein